MNRREMIIGGAAIGVTSMSAQAAAKRARRKPGSVMDPSFIDPHIDSRSISFENPAGGRGAGGATAGGRKGRPSYVLAPGETVTLADIDGSGVLRHIWMTMEDWPPEVMRAQRFEVFYDGMAAPSISTPLPDFFALPHGRRTEFYSALIAINEGRGFNSYIPMPFSKALRMTLTNESKRFVTLYYQVDYTLEPPPGRASYLHVTFRRENPTVQKKDFVIEEGLEGPGRFLGCSVGVRVIDEGFWYGEGEVKIYRDGDRDLPTICGTGLEDYAGSAWGLGRHSSLHSGSPVQVPEISPAERDLKKPVFVGFYRWHVPDPIMFSRDLRVTIQQIGAAYFLKGQEAEFEAYRATHPGAGRGWITGSELGDLIAFAIAERSDDYCASSFVYCERPQAVPRYDAEAAVRDIGLLPDEPRAGISPSEDVRDYLNSKIKEQWGG
jgi:hypothetical protein